MATTTCPPVTAVRSAGRSAVAASAASLTRRAGGQEAALLAGHPSQAASRQDGPEISAGIGTGRGRGVGRLLRYAYAQGIRAFDTSAAYQSEPDFKDWFQQEPAVRKEIFIVTKEHEVPGIASQLRPMIDERCAAMGTDYIDLFFVHSFGDDGVDASLKLLESKELKVAADAAKKSGKVKLFGLSTHHRDRAAYLQTAAEVGFIDAIMVQYSPWLDKESALSKALDACHERGIGLISMKQIAGRLGGGETLKGILDAVERVPAHLTSGG